MLLDMSLQKLYELGISSQSLDWFHSYLMDCKQKTRIQDVISDGPPLKYGVPQGSILGPVLFTVYDLLSVPTYCKLACCVNYSKLYMSFPSIAVSTAINNLNVDLESIAR